MLITTLKVSSPAFKDNGRIPAKYTCDGININPGLLVEDIPEQAHSLVLIMDDPDAPVGVWDHWIVWNIPANISVIAEDSVPGVEGLNDFNQHHYGGPCPPSGKHRYFFKLFALDTKLELSADTRKLELEKAMIGHIIAFGETMGVYARK